MQRLEILIRLCTGPGRLFVLNQIPDRCTGVIRGVFDLIQGIRVMHTPAFLEFLDQKPGSSEQVVNILNIQLINRIRTIMEPQLI